jgi:drug/metabolite transporter (DMT)-like permease
MRPGHLTLKTFMLVLLSAMTNILAQLLLKKGLLETGIDHVTLANTAEFVVKNASSVFIWLGVTVYSFNFFVWIVLLYKVDLSIAIPAGSMTYLFTPLFASVFLHENIGIVRWTGILLIVAGIHFIYRSGRPVKENR